MTCLSPYMKFDGEGVAPFPCGSCPNCRKAKSNEWSLRISLESLSWSDLAFVTLTYDNENCPKDYSLVPAHLSSFVKRLRRRIERQGVSGKIRYYGVGEYGDKFGRPHYHLIIFGLKPEDFHLVELSWKMGIIDVQKPISREQASNYVAGYVTKKFTRIHYGNRVPPFNRQSMGLGKAFVLSLPFYTPYLQIGKHKRYLGRFLKNKLAEKFGVLENIKKDGLQRLYEKVSDVVINVYERGLIKIEDFFDNRAKVSSKCWSIYFEGEVDEAYSRLKLIQRKDL